MTVVLLGVSSDEESEDEESDEDEDEAKRRLRFRLRFRGAGGLVVGGILCVCGGTQRPNSASTTMLRWQPTSGQARTSTFLRSFTRTPG